MITLARIFVLLTLLHVSAAGSAQSIGTLALYEGADRQTRLVEGAKKEGSVTLYATTQVENLRVIMAGFEKKYGVKVNLWRSRSENVLQRIINESRGGKDAFDVVEVISPPLEAMRKEGLIQRVNSPLHNDLLPWAVPPNREWAATQLYTFVQAYNTDKVKKEDLPKTYTDLLDPKWKGKLSIEGSDHEWFYEVAKQMGEEKGLKFWRDLVATNGLQVRTGHTLLSNLVGAGEVPLAITVYNDSPYTAKQKGTPIEWFVFEPAIAIPNGVAVSRKAPHPHAALLFYEYMLGEEGQQVLSKAGYITSHKKITSIFDKKLKVLDAAVLLEEHEKSNRLFEQIIIKGGAR